MAVKKAHYASDHGCIFCYQIRTCYLFPIPAASFNASNAVQHLADNLKQKVVKIATAVNVTSFVYHFEKVHSSNSSILYK